MICCSPDDYTTTEKNRMSGKNLVRKIWLLLYSTNQIIRFPRDLKWRFEFYRWFKKIICYHKKKKLFLLYEKNKVYFCVIIKRLYIYNHCLWLCLCLWLWKDSCFWDITSGICPSIRKIGIFSIFVLFFDIICDFKT